MITSRPILEQEKNLITHLLKLAKAEQLIPTIPDEVSPYNTQQPESINLSGTDAENYAGDIIAAEYWDTDHVRVVISLTQDHEGHLLDMDFWKEDFSNVLSYPLPEQLKVL